MLVLTRRINDAVYIGDDVVVTVLDVVWRDGGSHVKLGVTAPDDVPIARCELGPARGMRISGGGRRNRPDAEPADHTTGEAR